jgi:hypothetical protein
MTVGLVNSINEEMKNRRRGKTDTYWSMIRETAEMGKLKRSNKQNSQEGRNKEYKVQARKHDVFLLNGM